VQFCLIIDGRIRSMTQALKTVAWRMRTDVSVAGVDAGLFSTAVSVEVRLSLLMLLDVRDKMLKQLLSRVHA